MNRFLAQFNWRRIALLMMVACGGQLAYAGAYFGAALLVAFAAAVLVATEVKF
jgi:hypothetical protein